MEENTIWNHGNGYKIPSITESGNNPKNSGITHLLDPTKYLTSDDTGFVQGFWNDLMGFTSQSREFAQQEYLQDKMNEYNTPANQMKRMEDAGINLNTAAAGIAGSGSESAQAPAVASNEGGVAQGVGSLASALTGGSSAALAFAQRRQAISQAENLDASTKDILATIQPKLDQMAATTAGTWIKAGLDKEQANYWSVKAAYANSQERLDILSKGWAIRQTQKEIRLLNDEHDQNIKKLAILKEQVSQEEYRTEQMRIDTELKKGIEAVYQKYGVDITLPDNAMLIQAEANGHLDDILDVFSRGNYAAYYAQYSAQADTAYDIAYNNALGSAEGNEDNQKFLSLLQANVERVKAFYAAYYALPDDLKSAVAQLFGKAEIGVQEGIGAVFDTRHMPKLHKHVQKWSKYAVRVKGGSARW